MYIGIRNLDPKLNPTPIFSDRDLTVPLANPQTLDSFGRSTNKIWIPGRYSMKIEDSDNVQKYEELDLGELPQTGITSLSNVQGINTITGSATPAISAYVDKEVFLFTPANTNTGSTTLNIDSVGAKTIEFSNAVLSGGELLVGATYQVAFNETDDVFDLLGPAIATKTKAEVGTNNINSMTPLRVLQSLAFNKSNSGNVLADHKNLIIKDASTSTVDIDADQIELADTNSIPFLAKSVNVTVNIATDGINGCPITAKTGTYSTTTTAVTGSGSAFDTEFAVGDVLHSDTEATGRKITAIASSIAMTLDTAFGTDVSAGESVERGGEAPSALYYIFAAYNGTSVGAFLDTSRTSPDAPTGFTFTGLVGGVINDSSSDFLGFFQFGKEVFHIVTIQDINDTGSGTTENLATLTCFPDVWARFSVVFNDTVANTCLITATDQTDSDPSNELCNLRVSGSGVFDSSEFIRRTDSIRQIRYRTDSNADVDIFTQGWRWQ